MSTATADIKRDLPVLMPFIKTTETGEPYLAGSRCQVCHEIFVGERHICANCTTRDKMTPIRLAETGKIYAYTIVDRSFPGVKTPFVDVTVDLDDGAHLKGTLEDVEPTLQAIRFDMPVKLAYRAVTPINKPGESYLSYVFIPA